MTPTPMASLTDPSESIWGDWAFCRMLRLFELNLTGSTAFRWPGSTVYFRSSLIKMDAYVEELHVKLPRLSSRRLDSRTGIGHEV